MDGATASAFCAFDADPGPDIAVLWGEGGHFCAGADLKAFAEIPAWMRVSAEGDAPLGVSRMTLSKPVIAAVSGYAVAGGLELAYWYGLRVAEESAIFGVFCGRFGVPLIDGGTARLPRLIGRSGSGRVPASGRAVRAGEALHMGLVSRVVADGTTRQAAEALAASMRLRSRFSLRRACATIASPARTVGPASGIKRCEMSSGTGWRRSRAAKRSRGPGALAAEKASRACLQTKTLRDTAAA